MAQFEADLCPETGVPRFRLNFANGWSISIVLVMPDKRGVRFGLASVAACPTGYWGTGATELLGEEATPDEVSALMADVAAWPRYTGGMH